MHDIELRNWGLPLSLYLLCRTIIFEANSSYIYMLSSDRSATNVTVPRILKIICWNKFLVDRSYDCLLFNLCMLHSIEEVHNKCLVNELENECPEIRK